MQYNLAVVVGKIKNKYENDFSFTKLFIVKRNNKLTKTEEKNKVLDYFKQAYEDAYDVQIMSYEPAKEDIDTYLKYIELIEIIEVW